MDYTQATCPEFTSLRKQKIISSSHAFRPTNFVGDSSDNYTNGSLWTKLVSPQDFEVVSIPGELDHTLDQIKALSKLSENWNGNNVLKPNIRSIKSAERKIIDFFLEVDHSEWLHPNVTADENGDAVLEWWNNTKKLTMYFDNEHPYYLMVCGPDINSQMEDGEIRDSKDFIQIWNWLVKS